MKAKTRTTTTIVAIALATTMATSMLALTGCSTPTIENEQNEDITTVTSRSQRLARIPDTQDLAYDTDTLIVYYMIDDYFGYKGYGWMSPYYGQHGRLCQYIDGQIQELPPDTQQQ